MNAEGLGRKLLLICPPRQPPENPAKADCALCRVVADVWEKDIWEFQAKSGSSGSCGLFLHFLGKIAVQEMPGKTPGSPRRPSSRHPRPSDSDTKLFRKYSQRVFYFFVVRISSHQDRIYPHPLGDRNSDHGLSFPSRNSDHGLSFSFPQ